MSRRLVRVLSVLAAGAVGFVAVFLVAFMAGLWMNVDAECDGVCTDMLGIVGALALVLGLLGALAAGWAAVALLDRGARRTPP